MSVTNSVVHGSIVYARDSSILQVVGIPSPPNLLPVIPKYVPCRKGPWERPSGRYCRVVSFYGPQGVRDAIARYGVVEREDPLYGSAMPYIGKSEVLHIIEPREAMEKLLGSARLYPYVSLVEKISRESSISIENLGVTGSIAAGIDVPGFSDLDLVVYGGYNAAKMLEYFLAKATQAEPLIKNDHGGLKSSPIDIRWRRQLFEEGLHVSWVGIGLDHEKCAPLRSYWTIETPEKGRVTKRVLEVEPRQETALTYPPCVKAINKIYIVSFEFNVGILLYRGGRILVEGVPSTGGNVIYVGLREFPGGLYKLDG